MCGRNPTNGRKESLQLQAFLQRAVMTAERPELCPLGYGDLRCGDARPPPAQLPLGERIGSVVTRMRYRLDRLVAYLRDLFGDLPRRAVLTIQYHGWRELAVRAATFPLRLTPWGSRKFSGRATRWAIARDWYRRKGRPVAIVIPHYGDPGLTLQAIESIKATTKSDKVRIVISDDATPDPQHVAKLRATGGITLVESDTNTGFAANVNRGIAAAGDADVVLLNNDVIAMPGWLEQLQFQAYKGPDIGITGPKLLYPDGSIQSAGSHRNLGAPEWFDHRYRFRPSDHGPADVVSDVLAVTGAAMYLKAATLAKIGTFDESYGMAYEDVDLCLRCWDAGLRVTYAPGSTLTHLESKTRPVEPGRRELDSQKRFWDTWARWLDEREVRTAAGALRVVYVTEDTGVGGGHRVVFEHLNGLKERGHEPELWTLEKGGEPDWYDLKVPVRLFPDYETMIGELRDVDAVKVATWWNTAAPVWLSSVRRGIGAYFVQDIETSYYPGQPEPQNHVMNSYRHEFRYLTTSQWVGDKLRELHVDPVQVPPGIDGSRWHPLDGVTREDDVLLAVGRTNPLKNFELTADAYRSLPEAERPRLWLFGVEPDVGADLGARYFERPSDAQVNELYNQATALIQTSRHEGFCLPLLEAMAAGLPVICTDSDGNRDFIRDGENCLLVEDDPESVAAAVKRLFGDPELRDRLRDGGLKTAAEYELQARLDEVERWFAGVADAAAPTGLTAQAASGENQHS
jgi:GT2 family glycosyltransferase/glycosyltransferase involved in cell wall biosynthesis